MAGDVLDTRQFPVVDLDRGSIQGELLRSIGSWIGGALDPVDAGSRHDRRPGHGRLCDVHDVVEYRDMVTIIRDRVRDLMKAGRSLADVKAAQPAMSAWTLRHPGGTWTTDRFVEAVYRSWLKESLEDRARTALGVVLLLAALAQPSAVRAATARRRRGRRGTERLSTSPATGSRIRPKIGGTEW